MPSFKDDRAKAAQAITDTAIVEKLGIKTQAARTFLELSLANVLLMDVKQQDYGSANISKFGAHGCVIRMSDKFERLVHLYKSKRRKPQNESLIDSFRDLSNYAIIATQCELNLWPNE
jgi:hypothetical protein